MTKFVADLPLWLSLGFSLIGVIVSIRLAWLAYKGILFVFALLLTAGVIVFGFSHLIKLADPGLQSTSQLLEAVASAMFLQVALFMLIRLRQILRNHESRR